MKLGIIIIKFSKSYFIESEFMEILLIDKNAIYFFEIYNGERKRNSLNNVLNCLINKNWLCEIEKSF